jgi:hypothetical protein
VGKSAGAAAVFDSPKPLFMMLCNIHPRREALEEWPAHDPSRERASELLQLEEKGPPKEQPPRKLSGKRTAKEMIFWKAACPTSISKLTGPPKG